MKHHKGLKITIANVAPHWNGKTSYVIDHIIDSWYNVQVGDTRLVLDRSKGEMV